jgi:hypothetical protein
MEMRCACGAVEVVEVYRTPPQSCAACRKAKAVEYRRAWLKNLEMGDDGVRPDDALELEQGRLRLSCELEDLKAKVRALARDLEIAA